MPVVISDTVVGFVNEGISWLYNLLYSMHYDISSKKGIVDSFRSK